MLPRDPRLIDVCWPDWDRPLPQADGLVVFVAGTDAPTAWADQILRRSEDGFVLWAATGARPGPAIASVLTRRGVRAVALAPASVDPRHVQAALQLARRLSDHVEPGQPAQTSVTSPTPPEGIGEELVPIPHLVTLHTPEGFRTDTMFWLLLPAEGTTSRFAIPTPGNGAGRIRPDPHDLGTTSSRHPGVAQRPARADRPPPGRSTNPSPD